MQVLWSRAAQARSSCSCRSCLHTATSVARRTTTAVTKRRVKVSDILTACYSTILATAAVADMRVKEERRKEWDRVIAEAKVGMPTTETSGRAAIEAGDSEAGTSFKSNWKPTGQAEMNYKPMAVSSPASWHTQLELKLQNMGSQLENEFSYFEEAPDVELPAREPLKPLHLHRMQDMIARLASQFLAESRIFSDQPLPECTHSDIQLQTVQMRERLKTLMEDFTSLPSYEWRDVNEVTDQRDALNRSLHALCRSKSLKDGTAIKLMLAKISYNMLVSTSPPSMMTYNILLAEFTRLGEPRLAQIVVDSFMHDSKFKPSKTAVKLILDHYRAKGDPHGFRSVIMRMRATHKGGPDIAPDMRVKKRQVRDLVKPTVQEWAMNARTIHRNDAIYEKTPRNAAILDSLINGCLEFQGVQPAVRHIRSAFREGHTVHHDTLCSVIRACLDQANFSHGVKLIRNILSPWEDGFGDLVTVYTEDLRQLIYQLLVMCGFDTSLKSTQDLPIKASWNALQDLLHYMHLESVTEALDRCADLTVSVSQSIGLTGSDEAGDFESEETPDRQLSPDIDRSLQLVEDYSVERQMRATHQKQLEVASRWSRLDALDLLIDKRWKNILVVESELTSLLYDNLSGEQKAHYDAAVTRLATSPPSMAFVERHRILLNLHQPAQSLSEQAVVDREHPEPLAQKKDSIAIKQVTPRSMYGASFRPPIPFPIKSRRPPFSVSMPLAAMREKAELEAAAAS